MIEELLDACLAYSMEELKSHIEKLFEPWMSWDNWGVYDPDIWNDDLTVQK